jgi:hypothetical protein
MGCYRPPPSKEILSQDLERRGTRNDDRRIDQVARRISGIRTVERRRSSQSSMRLFLIGRSGWKRTFSNSNVKDKIPNRGKRFQTESINGTIGDDIILHNRT